MYADQLSNCHIVPSDRPSRPSCPPLIVRPVFFCDWSARQLMDWMRVLHTDFLLLTLSLSFSAYTDALSLTHTLNNARRLSASCLWRRSATIIKGQGMGISESQHEEENRKLGAHPASARISCTGVTSRNHPIKRSMRVRVCVDVPLYPCLS